MLYYMLDAHLFLQPQNVPTLNTISVSAQAHTSHRTVSLNPHRNHGNQTDVTGDHED